MFNPWDHWDLTPIPTLRDSRAKPVTCIDTLARYISPFLNTCIIEDIIQVLHNQGRGEGGGMAKYYTLITEGGGGLRRLQN